MNLGLDISDPVNQELVGTTVCVIGSYSGDDGSPFTIKCKMENTVLGISTTKTASIDTQQGTWQATFSGLTPSVADNKGSYTVFAWAEEPELKKLAKYTNPVTGVEVTEAPPIEIEGVDVPAPSVPTAAAVVTVWGSYQAGSSPGDGFVVNAYLTIGGVQVSESGRLHAMRDGHWEYRLRTRLRQKLAVLHVELWPVNSDDQQPKPRVKLARVVTI